MRIRQLALGLLAAAIMSACSSHQKVLYLQDLPTEEVTVTDITNFNDIRVQPGDQINIKVSCKEPQLAQLFNLVEANTRLGTQYSNYNSQSYVSPYTVSPEGKIDFPVLGEIEVAGETRGEIAAKIKKLLVEEDLVKDPVVTVEFLNLHFSVIGEVTRPGAYAIQNDRVDLFEALALAGDLTIYGERDRVYVIREKDGKRQTFRLDLRSKEVLNSPAYYLQQNDVIYVEPNKVRASQSTVNENNWRSVSLWLSMASVLTSIAILIFR